MIENKSLLPQLLKNSVLNVISLLVTLILGFVTTPIILSLLGTSRYGLMVLLTSILFPLGLATLNLGQATIKYVAEALGKSDFQQAGLYVRTTLGFNLIVGLVGTAIVIALGPWLTTSVFKIELADREIALHTLYWLAFGWTINQVIATYSSVPVAFQRYDMVTLGNVSYSITSAVFSISVLYFTSNLVHYAQVRVFIQFLSIIMWLSFFRKLLPGVKIYPTWNKDAFHHSFRFGFWQTLGQLGGIISTQADKYILGILLSTAMVGLYDIAMTVQKQAYTLGMKFGEVLFPTFSYKSAANDRQYDAMILMRSTWILTLLSAGIMVPVIVLGGDFLRLWVGPTVALGSAPVLRVLAFGGLLGSASNAGAYYLLGIGKTKWSALISIATGATVLMGSLLFVPKFGLMGAGWGGVIAMFVQASLVTYMWHKLFRKVMPMRMYMPALYGPVVIGAMMAVIMLIVRLQIDYVLSWFTLVFFGIIVSLLTVLPIVMLDPFFPGGNIRRQDIIRLIHLLSPYRLREFIS